jgi:hypothetical protein
MSVFGRRFDEISTVSVAEHPWWDDLLRLWRPSGTDSGCHGLRLAVRNGYLNFYRLGQSIAKVAIGRDGALKAAVHTKYIAGPDEPGFGEGYARLQGRHFYLKGSSRPWRDYEGAEQLIGAAETVNGAGGNKGYAGVEKRFVDQVVAANTGVIDLEMALPAWGQQATAPRMDLVALERGATGLQAVFWEAKLVGDSRIRCSAGRAKTDEVPEVLAQLARYRIFLEQAGHQTVVANAYKEAARILLRLRDSAAEVGNDFTLSNIFQHCAGDELLVDPKPRLLVFKPDGFSASAASEAAWQIHQSVLMHEKVSLQVIDHGQSLELARSQ